MNGIDEPTGKSPEQLFLSVPLKNALIKHPDSVNPAHQPDPAIRSELADRRKLDAEQ